MEPDHHLQSADSAVSPAPADLLGEIMAIDANEQHMRTLVELLASNGRSVIPFVGAGMSRPYDFAIWRDFLLHLADKARIRKGIKDRIKLGQFEEAADDLLDALHHTAFHDAIDEEYGLRKLAGRQIAGAHSHLAKLAVGPVITTNFDHVLETAFEQAQSGFTEKIWGAKARITADSLHKNERILLKLHGDVKDTTERILTKDDYEAHYGSSNGLNVDMSKPLPKVLSMILVGRPLLFIGCSLNNDRTINVLEQVAKDFRAIRHYAILEMPPSKKEFLEKKRFLSDHNIRPIWYPYKHHEYIEPILKYLADHVNP